MPRAQDCYSTLIAGVDTAAASTFFVCLAAFVAVVPFGLKSVRKVQFLEEVSADPVGALQSAFTFLGIDPALSVDWEGITSTNHNPTSSKKKEVLGVQVSPGTGTILCVVLISILLTLGLWQRCNVPITAVAIENGPLNTAPVV